MGPTSEHAVSVVVMELGARWPDWLRESLAQAPNSIVEAQLAEESAEGFADRVIERLKGFSSKRYVVKVGFLVASGAGRETALSARYRIARALLTTMSSNGSGGELLLTAEAGVDDDTRHELFALAGALCDEIGGTDLSVRVRFTEPRPDSARIPSVLSDIVVTEGDRISETAL